MKTEWTYRIDGAVFVVCREGKRVYCLYRQYKDFSCDLFGIFRSRQAAVDEILSLSGGF